jgi:hypothetical protein
VIAAGQYQSIAITDTGLVVQWGKYSDTNTGNGNFYSVTNTSVATLPLASNVMTVAAGTGQALALLNTNGTVVAWGLTNDPAASVPNGLVHTNMIAISCGWQFNIELNANGTVITWGKNTYGQTNVPVGLTNVTAIAAGAFHSLAVSNGCVIAWGRNDSGQCNVPSAAKSGVVAVAAGYAHSLALLTNGCVVAWGTNNDGQITIPSSVNSNVMAIAAGDNHSVALLNNWTMVAWGTNGFGQTNIPQSNATNAVKVKLIAAGGNQTMAGIWSSWVQYPVNVANDLLLITNNSSVDSYNVCQYYLSHRPMVSTANSIGLGCTMNEGISLSDYQTTFSGPIVHWLTNNPTKRPRYVILFQDLPSCITNIYGTICSVQYDIESGGNTYLGATNYPRSWTPFVTAINMNGAGGANDCIQYISKVAYFGNTYSPGKVVISVPKNTYGNTNYYFDDVRYGYPPPPAPPGTNAAMGVWSVNPSASITYTSDGTNDPGLTAHITSGSGLAGYLCWGWHSSLTTYFATDGNVNWSGTNSGWWIIRTVESYNGDRNSTIGNFLTWFASDAFGSSNNYTNTPVGAVCYVNEPDEPATLDGTYFGLWESGFNFAICAYNSRNPAYPGYYYTQAVGDPFVSK